MTHPIGFYASRPKGHPDHEILLKLEQSFGSCFQKLSVSDLCTIMTLCSLEVEGHYRHQSPWEEVLPMIQQTDFWHRGISDFLFKLICNSINSLSAETKLDLIPFIAEQIRNRPR